MTNSTTHQSDRRAELSETKQSLLQARLRGKLRPATSNQIQPRETDLPVGLSFAQRRIWFLQQLDPESAAYNIHSALRLRGPLDSAALARGLDHVAQRHESLRTLFAPGEGLQPVQTVEPARSFELQHIDLTHLGDRAQPEEVRRLTITATREPFDLTNGPLLRANLLRLAADDHVFVVVVHHIAFDEWSDDLFWHELATAYSAFLGQEPPALPALPIQYADYAHWEEARLCDSTLDAQLAYWRQQLQGDLPLLQLPLDSPRPKTQRFDGALQRLSLTPTLTAGLRQISQQAETTLFMTLLAAFALLLQRYTSQEEIVVGTPISNRTRPELANLIGMFLNTLALRLNVRPASTFVELLAQVRQVALDAFANQELPFEVLVDALHPERRVGQNPLFQVMFVYQRTTPFAAPFQGLEAERLPLVDSGSAKFDLTLFAFEEDETIEIAVEYRTDLFAAASIERLLDHSQGLLAGVLEDPNRRIGEVQFMTRAERQRLLHEWNGTADAFLPDGSIHHLIEEQARQQPQVPAVADGETRLTYRDLNQRANQLAHYLRRLGVTPNTSVGLMAERSTDMIVAMLGVLKAGGAYLPLDSDYPPERLAFMLADSRAPVVLVQRKLADRLPASAAKVLVLDDVDTPQEVEGDGGLDLDIAVHADNLAYLIYTSGSTGVPKGVPVTHRNLLHSTAARFHYYREPVQRFLLLSSFAFDSSVVGIFWTLCQGGLLVLPESGIELEVRRLAAKIDAQEITHILLLPSLYALLLEYAESTQLHSLRTVIVAGEECPRQLVDRHYASVPDAVLFNEYGPTEATVWSTVFEVPSDFEGARVPIGRPIPNTRNYILDANHQLTPVGVPGELCIGGAGVTSGYLNQPALTAESFIPDPFVDDPDARLYKTGDLCRHRPDGAIEYLGRIDEQIKMRGYRVEPGEIEEVLRQHPNVREAAVVVVEQDVAAPLDDEFALDPDDVGGLVEGLMELDAADAQEIVQMVEDGA